jgi:hypothetical protein
MVIQRFITCVNYTVIKSPFLNKCRHHVTNRLIHTGRYILTDRLYTDKHEWIEFDGKIGKIGISQYAQVRNIIDVAVYLTLTRGCYFIDFTIVGGAWRRSIRTVTRCRHCPKTER